MIIDNTITFNEDEQRMLSRLGDLMYTVSNELIHIEKFTPSRLADVIDDMSTIWCCITQLNADMNLIRRKDEEWKLGFETRFEHQNFNAQWLREQQDEERNDDPGEPEHSDQWNVYYQVFENNLAAASGWFEMQHTRERTFDDERRFFSMEYTDEEFYENCFSC